MNKMLSLRLRSCLCSVRRNYCAPPPSTPSSSSQSGGAANPMSPRYKPTEFQKFILVWTKKFKTKEEIPTYVSGELIDKSRSQARIKIANVLMLLTALASFGAIMVGKSAAKRGESVHQYNLDWHKKYEEEFKAKEAAAANK
ncbi:hypothetical protein PYW07_001720 [Mythimna separata]|uniref:Uncharacterized protein n=1 Tax=Mythimna separata TaxID=271217 RepID=A0AAD7YSY2_MYTSE|nr:hypothetical protein PYW07_001720 [Mythimna separata]